MFTGLVEGIGKVSEVVREGSGVRITIRMSDEIANACRPGDSVSLGGCCLTVVSAAGGACTFQAGPETLAKTTLGRLRTGDAVNIEPFAANGRVGGHFVQGHVDGVAEIETLKTQGEWVDFWFRGPQPLVTQMVPKGSVAIDGVSLTLVEVQEERFSVAFIPHTLEATTFGVRRPGDAVNIETDILGKYVKKFCSP